jgi:hypothetical protein
VLLAAASPLLVLYSAEARAYALLSVLCLSAFLLAARGPETRGRLAALAAVSAAVLYTHYLALFAVAALATVSLLERRTRSALAIAAGSLPFLAWAPIMSAQPHAAVAWMHEPPSELVGGILSSLGGAGDIPRPFGAPLPMPLVLAGVALTLACALPLARSWRDDADARRAVAFVVLFFGAVLLASLVRPVAFAGRTEMAVLPVFLWTIAAGGERSRALRLTAFAMAALAIVCSATLLSGSHPPSAPARAFERLATVERPGDAIVAGAHFYLPARLAADRGRLRSPVYAFPADQAAHPGWTAPVGLSPTDGALLDGILARAAPGSRVFFVLPESYAAALGRKLRARGVTTPIVRSPEMAILAWSPASGAR